eukprot:gnl/Hemi2/1958_TR702_c0_g1_i1.p1 gnl/Hemi2/1958_TR702_c0_g1~~gnl/Hemi2/1958_TR702_c0_g1_i1.p1  ORF type:complete len:112 (-),score=39.99 gnl/Hemi2/1958_TR702_c0_g1_i1:321-614(-)
MSRFGGGPPPGAPPPEVQKLVDFQQKLLLSELRFVGVKLIHFCAQTCIKDFDGPVLTRDEEHCLDTCAKKGFHQMQTFSMHLQDIASKFIAQEEEGL